MRVLLALLFLLGVSLLSVPGRADPLPTAAEIQDRAQAAEGPEPANYRETIAGEGSLGSIKEVTFHAGDDKRTTYDRGGLHYETGTYHGEDWEQNENGLTIVVVKEPTGAAPDRITTTVTRVTAPVDAYLVSALNVRGAGTRTYYDPTTYRKVRTESVDATGTVVTTYDAFATFGARTLPQQWTVSSKESALSMHYERTEYAPNAATAPSDVQEPETQRLLVGFPAGQSRVDLPVQIINNVVYVRVNIGSRAVDFILDTGSSGIFIDSSLAASLGLKLVNSSSEVTAARYTAYNAIVPTMSVGGLQMHDIAVTVGPMPRQFALEAKPLGLLGFDFLAQLGITIDYEHKKVTAVPALDFVAPSDPSTYAYDIRLGLRVPMIAVDVDGSVASRVVFDTGWSGDLAFFDYFTRRYPKTFRYDVGQTLANGVGGLVTAELFRVPNVAVGPLHFVDFVAMRMPASSYAFDVDGVVGNPLLSKFIVTLDYTDGHVYLTPSEATKRALQPVK